MTIQTFTYTDTAGSIVIPTQTVTAYQCCFTYDAGDGYGVKNRIVYRPSLINIGSRNDTRCSPTLIVPVYLLIYLGINLFSANYPSCIVEMYWTIFRENYPNPPRSGICTNFLCSPTPSVIDLATACHFVGTNEVCYKPLTSPPILYINTFMQNFINSYFDDCACANNPQWTIMDSNFVKFYKQKHNCDLINVVNTNPGFAASGYISSSLFQSGLFVVVS